MDPFGIRSRTPETTTAAPIAQAFLAVERLAAALSLFTQDL
jgi:hypothetical protein